MAATVAPGALFWITIGVLPITVIARYTVGEGSSGASSTTLLPVAFSNSTSR
jgi:hypothetical protein